MKYYNQPFAAAYGTSAYGTDAYQTGATTPAASTTTGATTGAATSANAGGSVLTNTGFDIAVTVTLAAVILMAAVAVRVIKRKPARETINN